MGIVSGTKKKYAYIASRTNKGVVAHKLYIVVPTNNLSASGQTVFRFITMKSFYKKDHYMFLSQCYPGMKYYRVRKKERISGFIQKIKKMKKKGIEVEQGKWHETVQ